MSEIYKGTGFVFVWLGVGEEPLAGEAVEDILPQIPGIAKRIRELRDDND